MKIFVVAAGALLIALLTWCVVLTVQDVHLRRACEKAGYTWLDVPVNKCISGKAVHP